MCVSFPLFFVGSQHLTDRAGHQVIPGRMERVKSWMSRSGSHVQNAVTRRSTDLSMEDAMQDCHEMPCLGREPLGQLKKAWSILKLRIGHNPNSTEFPSHLAEVSDA